MARSPKNKGLGKISVISTLMNEGEAIDKLMSMILTQTKKPNEVIVVDGGSTDDTYERLKKWKKKFKSKKIDFKLIQENGANIARGRNIAVKAAKNEYIASIDGGCIAKHDWLEKLWENKSDVVSGAYAPITSGFFSKILSRVVVPNMDKLPDDVEPSSRNIMFKKSTWKKVGGYPESLYTAEDSLYNFRLKQAGFKFKFARDAIVYWTMRSSLKSFLKQYYRYGKGDAQAKTPLWFLKNPKNKDARGSVFVLGTLYLPLILSLIYPPALILPPLIWFLEGVIRTKYLWEMPFTGTLMLLKRLSYLLGIHFGFLFNLTKSSKDVKL